MSKVAFNVDAYTAKLIGRENVANLDGAILELVKNTYDADASVCILYYDDIADTLYIGDNGTGMTQEIIQSHWMTIGSSSKKIQYTTKKGRVQTGAKGIGRFALDRIADDCQLLTKSTTEHLLWRVDWTSFEFGNKITDITADLDEVDISFREFISEVSNPDVLRFVTNNITQNGSLFKLTRLRDKWDINKIKSIKHNLKTLIPPDFRELFNIYMFDNATKFDEAAILTEDDSFQHDYKIEFKVQENGSVNVEVHRDEFDFSSQFHEIMKEAGFTKDDKAYFNGEPIIIQMTIEQVLKSKTSIENTIGEFRGVFYFAKHSCTKKDKEKYYYKDITGRPDIRDTFGGIRIYRDGFRVRPYGDSGTSAADWLQLAMRKNKSPAAISHPSGNWKVGGDQIHGSVYISRTNMTLPDQANRQGIVETQEFILLQEFLKNVIALFERDRQYVSRKLSEYHEKINPLAPIEKELEHKLKVLKKGSAQSKSIIQNPNFMEVQKVERIISDRDEHIKVLETELQMLRVLATTGIITNTYIHEIKGKTNKLGDKIKIVKEVLYYDQDIKTALEYIQEAFDIKNFFTSWFNVTVGAVKRDKRRLKMVDIGQVLLPICNEWELALEAKGIKIIANSEDIQFNCFIHEIESILNNLIANSASSFDRIPGSNKKIMVSIVKTESGIMIKYADNAAGLSSVFKKEPRLILEAFETDRISEQGEAVGTGMGMWIINRIVADYKGSIDLSANIESEKGFSVDIYMSEKGR